MHPQELHYPYTYKKAQTLNHMQLKKSFKSKAKLMESKLLFNNPQKGLLVIECGNVMTVFSVFAVKYLM